MPTSENLNSESTLIVNNKLYHYYALSALKGAEIGNPDALPFSLKIVLENLLRQAAKNPEVQIQIKALLSDKNTQQEISYKPTRVLMQDFTGVPAVVDLAAMREAVLTQGGNPQAINPLTPVDLVIDHSVNVDYFGTNNALEQNVDKEIERNLERYQFLRWGQQAFENFRVVPPGTGICHQVNLEYLAQVVWQDKQKDKTYIYPDTLVGTDSHTTMINALGILGWGVGGIEAEAVMLGESISMTIPDVIGMKVIGRLQPGVTATDLVLTIVELLRQKGVVGKFVEFFGSGLRHLNIADRATIANMAPEYGATCGFFPIDEQTIDYLRKTARSENLVKLVESYTQKQGLWYDYSQPDPNYTDTVILDLNVVEPSLAGPKRPQDRVPLRKLKSITEELIPNIASDSHHPTNGDLVIAAITSCTNTSNPNVMLTAGLLAKKAIEKGLQTKPWVKTSLAPGSKVVTNYLQQTGLQTYLDKLGFNLVGYGCTTCIGNSGPLNPEISQIIEEQKLTVSAVLSGNRNFEGRIHPLVKANWLASPPLVVAFALAGTTNINLSKEPIGIDTAKDPVYLKDIWPSAKEIEECQQQITKEMFQATYNNIFDGSTAWQSISAKQSTTFAWDPKSTYIKQAPFFDESEQENTDIKNAKILALLGDSVTTDHISPAGVIAPSSPAGEYLQSKGIEKQQFNSYGARRGNHEVMMRGTFANIRIRNKMVPEKEGGYTRHIPTGELLSIYDAAMRYQVENTPLVIFAGKEYGTGSSRDWAAKGTRLLGVKAVIAESFERIHRSNLIGMGVLPLQLEAPTTQGDLSLNGDESINLLGISDKIKPRQSITLEIIKENKIVKYELIARLDTQNEVEYYLNGGILHYVLSHLTNN